MYRTALTIIAAACVLSGCGDDDVDAGTERRGGEDAPFVVRGSTALEAPAKTAANRVANRFNVRVRVQADGTAEGFDAFCTRGAWLVLADRKISAEEAGTCRRNRVGFVRVPAGFEAVAVYAPEDFGLDCLAVADLRRVFAAGREVDRYDRLDPRLPTRPVRTTGAVPELSTADVFAETALDGRGISRRVAVTADPTAFARAIEDRFAIGYFGIGLDRLLPNPPRSLAIDAGGGCIAPSLRAVRSGGYELARPLYIYASEAGLAELPLRTLVVDVLRRRPETLAPGLVPLSEAEAERAIAAAIGVGRGRQ